MKWVKRRRTRNTALRKASSSPRLFGDTIPEAQLAKAVSMVAGTLNFRYRADKAASEVLLSLLMKDWASEGNGP